MPRPLARIGITPVSISLAGGKPPTSPEAMPFTTVSIGACRYSTRRLPDPLALERMQLLLDLLDLGVPHILAVHQVNEVLADVLGVITDALERAHHPHDIQRAADRARILHHERDALPVYGLIFLIDDAVTAHYRERQFGVEPRKGIERIVQHLADHFAEIAQFPVAVCRPLAHRQARGDGRDLLALIADALQIRDGLEDHDDKSQVRRRRRAGGQNAAAVLIDRALELIDAQLFLRDLDDQARVGLGDAAD